MGPVVTTAQPPSCNWLQLPNQLPPSCLERRHGSEVDPEDERNISELLLEQIEFADVVILNKCDLVSAAQRRRIAGLVASLNPAARVLQTTNSKVDLRHVVNTGLFSLEKVGWPAGLGAGLAAGLCDAGRMLPIEPRSPTTPNPPCPAARCPAPAAGQPGPRLAQGHARRGPGARARDARVRHLQLCVQGQAALPSWSPLPQLPHQVLPDQGGGGGGGGGVRGG